MLSGVFSWNNDKALRHCDFVDAISDPDGDIASCLQNLTFHRETLKQMTRTKNTKAPRRMRSAHRAAVEADRASDVDNNNIIPFSTPAAPPARIAAPSSGEAPAKRGRGRPRKHPLPVVAASSDPGYLELHIDDNSILFQQAKRDRSPIRSAKPAGFTAEDFGWKSNPGHLSPICSMIKRRLGERYVFPRIKLGAEEGDLTCLVDWDSWEKGINSTWSDEAASASYTLVLAFFVRRVEVLGDGYLELALLLDRYCSPFTPQSRLFTGRPIDRLEDALRRLEIVPSPTTCSILLAMRRRHRFVLESPSWPGFVFHAVGKGQKGSEAFDLDLLYADTNWPRSANTPEQSPRALSPSPYSPAKPSYVPTSPSGGKPFYAPTSPSYRWRSSSPE